MSENLITLKSVSELERMKFFIPGYQRGYRWERQQVLDLLEDINAFEPEATEIPSEQTWYCLQPLVVKSRNTDIINSIRTAETIEEVQALLKGDWEVIDGQQRLTTIYILLSYLKWDGMYPYSIEFETRHDSRGFLEKIARDHDGSHKNENIDYFHIIEAWKEIEDWFSAPGTERSSDSFKNNFRAKVQNHVKFIWYESSEKDPIEVFKNMNSGRIALTNAELIKALFLNRSNFKVNDNVELLQQQREIAAEWDRIEYSLQNEEFWLFLNNVGRRNRDTRIECIFDIACEMNVEGLGEEARKKIRTDKFRTFDYFYKYFQQCEGEIMILDVWGKVRQIFDTFEEWFSDLVLYHYVGYLVAFNTRITDILGKWYSLKDKTKFIEELKNGKNGISSKITNCKDLGKIYEISVPEDKTSGSSKTTCRPLLLLHNIQTVINQHQKEGRQYGSSAFYRFPFHLYKLENWDVEHIDSNTGNDLSENESRREYLINIYNGVPEHVQEKIANYFENGESTWDDLCDIIEDPKNALKDGIEKNQVWNFTLLDSSTNRSYGNSIFSAKRRIIIGKDKGEYIPIPKCRIVGKTAKFEIEANALPAKSSFIPPCTKHIFLKYYSAFNSDPNYWDKEDAEAYRLSIYNTLKEFGVTLPKDNKDLETGGGNNE